LTFNYAFEYAVGKVRENKERLEVSGTRQLLVYADDINLLGEKNINIIKRNAKALLCASEKFGL
jgi:hypothetical protein